MQYAKKNRISFDQSWTDPFAKLFYIPLFVFFLLVELALRSFNRFCGGKRGLMISFIISSLEVQSPSHTQTKVLFLFIFFCSFAVGVSIESPFASYPDGCRSSRLHPSRKWRSKKSRDASYTLSSGNDEVEKLRVVVRLLEEPVKILRPLMLHEESPQS